MLSKASVVSPDVALVASGADSNLGKTWIDGTFPSRIAITAMACIADSYDKDGFGLAGSHASLTEEVLYLLGPPFQDLPLRRRPESYLASTIPDLASVLEEADIFDLARNEFLAVDIVLPVIETDDD